MKKTGFTITFKDGETQTRYLTPVVALITDGFWLDASGNPLSNTQFFKSNANKVEEKDRLWLDMTSEEGAFSHQELLAMLALANTGVNNLVAEQKKALNVE